MAPKRPAVRNVGIPEHLSPGLLKTFERPMHLAYLRTPYVFYRLLGGGYCFFCSYQSMPYIRSIALHVRVWRTGLLPVMIRIFLKSLRLLDDSPGKAAYLRSHPYRQKPLCRDDICLTITHVGVARAALQTPLLAYLYTGRKKCTPETFVIPADKLHPSIRATVNPLHTTLRTSLSTGIVR
jgi:hypothetical protein